MCNLYKRAQVQTQIEILRDKYLIFRLNKNHRQQKK